jgi:hypothetical protein
MKAYFRISLPVIKLNVSSPEGDDKHQTTCGPNEGCMGKLDCVDDHKSCGKLLVNETVETLMIKMCLSVDCLELKTGHISSKLWHIESSYAGGIYCYIGEGS